MKSLIINNFIISHFRLEPYIAYEPKLDSFIPFSGLIESLENIKEIDGDVKQKINGISEAINKIPKPTEQDAARDYVVVAQEKFEHFKNVSIRHKRALEKASTIDAIYKKYVKVSDNLLNQLYKDVEKQFSAFYQELNKEDEGGFTAKLIPSIGKLGFDVDFYGKGFFPPGAYHSEGHQDAMGLCLYLTLMKHLSGDNFTFAVLDDVLMSVDTGHRREVCNLLKTRFPNTQFIFTTHDDIWLKHMKTVGLIESSAHIQFCKWDVDNGPIDWHGRDIWDEIEKERKNNNVQIASSLLRNYLEYISKEICHRLRAKVEFRGDALFQLGDLMPSATSRFKKILKDAKKAANSWSNTKVSDKISGLEKDLSEKIEQSNVEQWQINQAIHYNEWANFSKEDFKPVVNAYFNLLKSFECSKCKGSYYVIPERGSKEVLRCPCNDFNLNLQKKN